MTAETKYISNSIRVDMTTARKLADTTPDGTYGIWIGQDTRGNVGEHVWLETNGDPKMLPAPEDIDQHDTPLLDYWLADADISRATLDELLADCDWWDAA